MHKFKLKLLGGKDIIVLTEREPRVIEIPMIDELKKEAMEITLDF